MLAEMVRYEWRYHTRQGSFVAACVLFLLFGFVLAATGFGPQNIHLNSPYSIMESTGLLSLLSLLILAVFCSSAIVRDRDHRTEEIIFSTAVGKREFLTARFSGAFLAALAAFSCSTAGMIAGAFIPNHDPARVGTLRLASYVWALAIMAVPNVLVATIILFAIAAMTRSLLASSAGAVVLYVLYFAASAWTNSPLMASSSPGAKEGLSLVALLDPFGLSAFFEQTQYWTPGERNARLTTLAGVFLANRMLWIAIAAGGWVVLYKLFAFRVLTQRGRRRNPARAESEPAVIPRYRPIEPRPAPFQAFLSSAAIEIRSHLLTLPFAAVTLLWAGLAASEVLSEVASGEYGSALLPFMGFVLMPLLQPLHLIALVVLSYFSAETVWRERTLGVDAILRATPAPSAAFVLAKWTALAVQMLALAATGIVAAVAIQLGRSFPDPDPATLVVFVWIAVAPLLIMAGAAILIHAVSPNKYLGMLIVLLLIVLMKTGRIPALQNPLFRFGATPAAGYSAFHGFGPSLAAFHWHIAYWALGAAICLTVAIGAWRLRGSWNRHAVTLALLLAAMLFTGARIFVRSDRETEADLRRWKAEYERTYRAAAPRPRPRIAHVQASIDLFPDQRRLVVTGEYLLRNESGAPMEEILVSVRREAKGVSLSMPGARLARRDLRYGHYWLVPARPLAPGASVPMRFELRFSWNGFDADPLVMENASFLMTHRVFPQFGYRQSYEIRDAAERRREGLPPRPDQAEEEERDPDWSTFDFTLSTAIDQTAVTSGVLERSWSAGARRFFRYRSERAVPYGVAFASARYRVARAQHGGIGIEVYYHPRHGPTVPRILQAAKDSLDALQEAYGRYPSSHLKIVEVPATAGNFGGLARPDTIFLHEKRALLIDVRNPTPLDLVYRRTAHEVAHQWWGMQLSPADEPGASLLTESLTKHSELMVLERAYGRGAVRHSLALELSLYLSGRADESDAEVPLARSNRQPYLYYRKGAIVMYALEDLLGKERFHRALRGLIAEGSGPGRRPGARQLVEKLREEAAPEERQLIDQWLNEIVTYDLRVEWARARPLSGGRFEVSMRVRAGKHDSRGRPLPFDEEIGVGALDARENVIGYEKRRLRSGPNDVVMIVSKEPESAAVDPYVLRVDLAPFDNVKELSAGGSE
jgi:ABC-type transport system involved in multi-copper enzyme maturation permease subunit